MKQVMWVWLGLLGWLAFLATLGLLVWLVRPGPPARPVPAVRLDSEDRKAYRGTWVHLGRQGWTESRVYPDQPDYLDRWAQPENLDHPVRSTRSSCVHLDSQGDLSC